MLGRTLVSWRLEKCDKRDNRDQSPVQQILKSKSDNKTTKAIIAVQ